MVNLEIVKEAGLSEGEVKVYLALLELGTSTTGAIIKRSKVARSFIYNILQKLIEKGLISYIVKKDIKHYNASDPGKILDYMEKRKQSIDETKNKIANIIPSLLMMRNSSPTTEIQVYNGFSGLQTAYEHYFNKCKKNDEILALGICSFQEEKYHDYWKKDHIKRGKKGIICKMLFNSDTNKEILKDRNSYKYCDARYMNTDIRTSAWIMTYKDVTLISLQDKKKPIIIEILNQQIADTFKAYFYDYWNNSKKLG